MGVPRNEAALFFLPALFLAEGCGGEGGAFPAWARQAWERVSFSIGRTKN